MSTTGLTWHVPPRCAGQIVEVSYAADCGTLFRRTLDRSDGSIVIETADASDCGCDHECDCWEPWNREPTAFDWRGVDFRFCLLRTHDQKLVEAQQKLTVGGWDSLVGDECLYLYISTDSDDSDDSDDSLASIRDLLGPEYSVAYTGDSSTDADGYTTYDVVVKLSKFHEGPTAIVQHWLIECVATAVACGPHEFSGSLRELVDHVVPDVDLRDEIEKILRSGPHTGWK